MNQEEFNGWFNLFRNMLCILCIICAYTFAFVQPIKSIAFTLLATFLALGNMQITTRRP